MIDQYAEVNGVQIAYQLHGDPNHPTIALVHGLSTPLTGWPKQMIAQFIAANFQVLLLDNRDIGFSAQLDHLKLPNMAVALGKYKLGLKTPVAYTLEDMMEDVVALLDYLGIENVDLVGASMGGMIAQLMAIHHPNRVRTLTSIMSTNGYKDLPRAEKRVSEYMLKRPESSDYQDKLAFHMGKWRVIESPDYPASDEYLREYVDSMMQRGIQAKGTMRQMLAILAAKSREKALSKLDVPTLVIHGDKDALVHVDGGKQTVKSIPNAKLKIYQGMGHDFPVELIASISNDIIAHSQTAL